MVSLLCYATHEAAKRSSNPSHQEAGWFRALCILKYLADGSSQLAQCGEAQPNLNPSVVSSVSSADDLFMCSSQCIVCTFHLELHLELDRHQVRGHWVWFGEPP